MSLKWEKENIEYPLSMYFTVHSKKIVWLLHACAIFECAPLFNSFTIRSQLRVSSWGGGSNFIDLIHSFLQKRQYMIYII